MARSAPERHNGHMERHNTVEAYLSSRETYGAELRRLREILGSTPLTEEVKWGAPAYTYRGKNLIGIAGFKEHFALWFHQGALLSDEAGVLTSPGETKAKAMRQWRFTSAKEIKVRTIKAYVKEAMALVDAGQEIKPERNKGVTIPPELAAALKKSPPLAKAFDALTPGQQRDYAGHIADAKRAATKVSRLAKIDPMIRAGGGLHDKYRSG